MVYYYISEKNLQQSKRKLNILNEGVRVLSKKLNDDWENIGKMEKLYEQQLQKAKETRKKIQDLKMKMMNDFLILKDSKLKEESLKELITKSTLIDVIEVGDEWDKELCNGLVDLKRDILMKLLEIIVDGNKTRNLIGMTKEFYEWSKLRVFMWARHSVVLAYPTAEDRYEGTACGKVLKPHGRGRCVYGGDNKGIVCEGDWVEGRFEGKGKKVYANGDKCEGDFVNGRMEGKGVFTKADGTRLEGNWVNDDMWGKGTHLWSNCETYEGDLIYGEASGWGKYTWSDGGKYEGEFMDGHMQGRGTRVLGDGDVYEGDFVRKHPEGSGIDTFAADGSKYYGDWVEGKRHGYGVELDREGNIVHVGRWVRDVKV